MKKAKLIFELFFIFVFPMLFMLFNVTFTGDSVSETMSWIELVYNSTFVYVDSPIYSLFKILFNVLHVDDNHIIFKILVDYTCLWFMQFIIWHIFYGIFDLFVHLFTKSNYKNGE